ncbi:MAG: terpene cyclase/mutase family protein [Oscillospiraceae bacterium]|nr:terpene cyclase/mutase family protein [Oscillospiraceae bacterium]
MKKLLALVIIFVLVFSGCKAEKIGTDYDFSEVAADTMAHIIEEAPNPGHNHINGEWTVIVAARGGAEIPEGWFDTYYENLCNTLTENDGVLSGTKHGSYSRAVLTLAAIGKDPTDVAGYNLLESYTDYDFVTHQGIPGSIFALLSLDSVGYEIPEGNVSREKLIQHLLDEEYEGGGWALMGEKPDVDMTAQAIQALAPYYGENEEVTAAIERAVAHLSEVQKPDGGFYAWESENVQTAAQVVIALSSIGIDIRTDERFIKEEGWIGSYIMQYYLGGGAFCHTLGTQENAMASDQCMQAFVAMELLENGEGRFYDFNDIG